MNWQEIIVILVVVAAAFYLYRYLRRAVMDHDCGECGLNQSREEKS